MIVRYAAAALADLDRLRDFLMTVDADLAAVAVTTIIAGASGLPEFPFRAPGIGLSGDRRLTIAFGRAAYLLDYRVEDGTVTVLRIRHSREAR